MRTSSTSASAIASACSAFLPSRASLRSLKQTNTRAVQNYLLVWLDSDIDELTNIDCRNTITALRQIVNSVRTFIEVDECTKFIANIKEEKVFIIVSEALSQTTVPIVHDMPQVSSIYVFCENKLEDEEWIQKWSKVRGAFIEISSICEALKQAAQECDQNSIAMSFIGMNDGTSDPNLDELDQSFIYTQILKETILIMDFEQQSIKDFISYCRQQFVGNVAELRNIDKLEREYHHHVPIWWYTYQCLLYSMLNRALGTMEMDMIVKMSFFIHDLHQHIEQLHSKQYVRHHHSTSFSVYRGQGMSPIDFDQLKKSQGGLLSFNNFLFTNKNRDISLDFTRRTIETSDQVGILFVMTIDPTLSLSTPFADIRDVSNYQTEEHILFSMHSVFRIEQIKQIDNGINRLWQVELTLTGDNDPQLHALTKRIREEIFPHKKGWDRLSEQLIKLGQLNKAQQLCDVLITQTSDDNEKGSLYYQLGLVKFSQGEYTEANTYYNLSLEIHRKTLSPEHVDVAACHNSIGLVYEKMGEYSKVLWSFEIAFGIYQKTLPTDHPSLAISVYNIGRVYFQLGEYATALQHFEKALGMYQETAPSSHSDMAAIYNNIGSVYEKMGEYSKALLYLEKNLEIHQKSHPSNHLNLINAYNNIGSVYEKTCEYSTALPYYEKALEICETSLPSNYSESATSHNNIGLLYFQMGDYTKALSSHEKAHKIYQATLPPDHPHLAASYLCHGAVYDKILDYPEALLDYEKALKIYEKSLPSNHPDLATSYNNIGSVYEKMGKYSAALLCHEKALEIYEKTSPSNHLNLANAYTWHGYLYDKMGNHSKALLFYEYALHIGQRSLRENHPCLQLWQSNLEMIKGKL